MTSPVFMSRFDCRANGVPAAGFMLRVTSRLPNRRLKAICPSSSSAWPWKTRTECSSKAARITAQLGSSRGRVRSAPSIRAAKTGVRRVTAIAIRPPTGQGSTPAAAPAGDRATPLANSIAYSRIHWKYFQKIGEYKGVKLLGVFTHGPGQMFTRRPVSGIADVQGLKIRTGGGIAEQVAKALGASAFVKPAPESYELLSSGVADGVFFPLESIISFKLDTVLEQATLFPGGMYSSSFGFFMNEDKWNKLPRQDQEAIEKISGEHIARLAGKSWDDADAKGMEALKKSGVKIVNADPELVAEVRKRSAPIIEDWIAKARAKGVDAAKILAEFREELKKVAAGK